MGGSCDFRIFAHIAAGINQVNIVEFLGHAFPRTVKGAFVNITAVGDKGDNAVLIHAIRGPADKARIHVVHFGLLRAALFDVSVLDPAVHAAGFFLAIPKVFTILVVVVFVHLVGIVRRIADDDRDFTLVLAFDAFQVFRAESE